MAFFGGAEGHVREEEDGTWSWILFKNNGGYKEGVEPTKLEAMEECSMVGIDDKYYGD